MTHRYRFRKHSDQRIVDAGLTCPSKKRGYTTKAIAIQEIAVLKRDNDVEKNLTTYKCKFCHAWHMTSKLPYS